MTMPKGIIINEAQLKNIVNSINEQNYDDAIEKYKKERDQEVFMGKEDARLLFRLAQNWCEGRVTHPDCEEIELVGKKLRL
jgi:hypothetical protein